MPLLQVIVLAVVQGLTEFLPVSSTAHLYLTSWLLGWHTEALDFDISLHIGTLLAVLLYFLRDWLQILAQGFGMHYGRDEELKHNRMMLWLLAIATIPVGVFGYVFKEEAETTWRIPFVMGVMLVAVGVVMWLAERAGRRRRDLSSLNLPDSVVIGLAQALSIVPGTSRSGITISAGLFRDFERPPAARFSFLLSTPAIAAAAGKALYDMHKLGGLHAILNAPFIVGVAVSALTGCAVIAWFLHYLRRSSLRPFVYYRIIFGIIIIALAFIRRPA
jgi:undecaprenyl-diphosphatase